MWCESWLASLERVTRANNNLVEEQHRCASASRDLAVDDRVSEVSHVSEAGQAGHLCERDESHCRSATDVLCFVRVDWAVNVFGLMAKLNDETI